MIKCSLWVNVMLIVGYQAMTYDFDGHVILIVNEIGIHKFVKYHLTCAFFRDSLSGSDYTLPKSKAASSTIQTLQLLCGTNIFSEVS